MTTFKSIEEKAKAYDKAIERAKSLIGDTLINESGQHIAEVIFPELKESEDERMRKGIESIIKHYKDEGEVICPYPFVTIEEALAWLKKQGEEKHWREEDESWFKEMELMCLNFSNDTDYREKFSTWLKSLKDRVQQKKQEWSDNDKEQLGRAIYMMEQLDMTKSWDDVYNWLKSLRERHCY